MGSEPTLKTGFVQGFYPDRGMYLVNLDGGSDAWAQPLRNGADKPYPAKARVVCLSLSTSTWMILGEVRSATIKKRTDVPLGPPAAVYLKDLSLRNALQDRYSITKADFSDPEQTTLLDGDTELANRKVPRSYLRILESGDIISLASNFCFMLLSAVKNLFYVRAKDALLSFVGFLFSVTLNEKDKTATVQVSINSDATDDADRDVELTAGAIPQDERPTKSYTGGERISEGVYLLLGTHTLLEVDNRAKEIRLSRVDLQAGKDVLGRRQQIRMNADEIAVDWDDGKSLKVDKGGIEGVWEKARLLLSKEETILERGDAGVSINDERARLAWDANNRIVLNANGVQVRGLLEVVGGRVKFSPAGVEDGVADGTEESITFEEVGGGLRATLNTRLTVLDINNDFTVRQQALVDVDFLTKYDTDMAMVTSHIHQIPPTPLIATPSQNLVSVGQSSGQRQQLTSEQTGS